MPAAPCTSGSSTTAASAGRARRPGRPPWSAPRGRRSRGPGRPGCRRRARTRRSAAGRTGRCRTRRRRATASRPCRRGRRARGAGSRSARRRPRLAQYWNAILSACSTAAAPSEANRKCGSVDRHHAGQRLGQLDHDAVAVAEQGRVRDAVELVAEGVVELGHAVAERRDPQRRDGVEVAPALDVDQLAALGRLHDDGLVVGVARHLGEPVPHDGGISSTPGPGVDHDPPA